MPYLNKEYNNYKQNTAGLIVLSFFISSIPDDDTDPTCAAWVAKNNVLFPSFSAMNGSGYAVAQKYGAQGVPRIILISPSKIVVEQHLENQYKNLPTVLAKYAISTEISQIKNVPDFFMTAKIENNRIVINSSGPGSGTLSLSTVNGKTVFYSSPALLVNGLTGFDLPRSGIVEGIYVVRFVTPFQTSERIVRNF